MFYVSFAGLGVVTAGFDYNTGYLFTIYCCNCKATVSQYKYKSVLVLMRLNMTLLTCVGETSLDWFSHFSTVHAYNQQTDTGPRLTDHATSIINGRILCFA